MNRYAPYILNLLSAVLGLAATSLCAFDPAAFSRPFLPGVGGPDLMKLQDRTYFFPANRDPADPTSYLALRKWDIIFTGDRLDKPWTPLDEANINHLIPGPFNHIMIYLGKDSRGLAYAAELNTSSFDDPGGLRILCLGSDFGLLRHPEDQDLHDRRRLNRRWAMRLQEDDRLLLIEANGALMSRIQADLAMGFPYQLEFEHSGNLFDPHIYLVDDGFEGGAGCSDYWTTLFEEYAGLCLKGVRMDVRELEDYFRNDPEGELAYAPPSMSPFTQPLSIRSILDLGYRAVAAPPHIFSCDGSGESGLVIPSRIMESGNVVPIPVMEGKVPLPCFELVP